jgi:hypothetical protein
VHVPSSLLFSLLSFLVHAAKLTNGNLGIGLAERQENGGQQLRLAHSEPQPTRALALSLLGSNLRPEALLPVVVAAVPLPVAACAAYTPPHTQPVHGRSQPLAAHMLRGRGAGGV